MIIAALFVYVVRLFVTPEAAKYTYIIIKATFKKTNTRTRPKLKNTHRNKSHQLTDSTNKIKSVKEQTASDSKAESSDKFCLYSVPSRLLLVTGVKHASSKRL